MSTFYFYAYGLKIKSSMLFYEIPQLSVQNSNPDVIIRFERKELFPYGTPEKIKQHVTKIQYSFNDIGVLLDDIPLFRIKNGKEVIVNHATTLNNVFLRSLILTEAMATLLHQRGYLILHASAVNIRGGAVAFLGACGNGKSTIATVLNNREYPVVTDDVLVIKFDENNNSIVIPSFPRIKLWPDTIKYIKNDPNSMPKIHPESQKRSYSVKDNFYLNSLPLKRIYVLNKTDDNKKNEIAALKPQEALVELIRHSYCAKIFGDSEKSQNLFQCANVIKNIPVNSLSVCQSLEKLEDLAKLVEEDVLKK